MNATHVAALTLAYLLGIPILMRIMKNRKPLNLGIFPVVHNAFLSLLSLYMVAEIIHQFRNLNYKWLCNAVDESPAALGV